MSDWQHGPKQPAQATLYQTLFPLTLHPARAGLNLMRRAVEHARALPPEKWPRPSHVNCKQAPKPSKSLCEELKACRDEIAAKYDVPPQLITPSTALLEIAAARPHTCEELKAVSKLCNWQVELIGEPFLRIIRAHEHASDVSPASSNLFD